MRPAAPAEGCMVKIYYVKTVIGIRFVFCTGYADMRRTGMQVFGGDYSQPPLPTCAKPASREQSVHVMPVSGYP